jgi:hypothetical protein
MKCEKCGSSVELGPFGLPTWRLKEIWDRPSLVEGFKKDSIGQPWWWDSLRAIEKEFENRGYSIVKLEVHDGPIERGNG